MGADAFRFDGKRAVVVGGASGMGAATASLAHELGAEGLNTGSKDKNRTRRREKSIDGSLEPTERAARGSSGMGTSETLAIWAVELRS